MDDYRALITIEIYDGEESINTHEKWMYLSEVEEGYREFEHDFLERYVLEDGRLLAVFNGLLCLKEIKEDE